MRYFGKISKRAYICIGLIKSVNHKARIILFFIDKSMKWLKCMRMVSTKKQEDVRSQQPSTAMIENYIAIEYVRNTWSLAMTSQSVAQVVYRRFWNRM